MVLQKSYLQFQKLGKYLAVPKHNLPIESESVK